MDALIIEKELDSFNFIKSVLEKRFGGTKIEAVDNFEALGKRNLPSILLIDIDQFDLKSISKLSKLAGGNSSILVISDSEQPERIIKALDLGAADYLFKPINERDLIQTIHSLARGQTNAN